MGARKRSRSEALAAPEQQLSEEPRLLQRIRNSWEFACVMQYIALFGKLMKIDEDFEIEVCLLDSPSLENVAHWIALDRFNYVHRLMPHAKLSCCCHRIEADVASVPQDLEDECLKPEPSYKLLEIGLCLLKWVSSHRGLTYVKRSGLPRLDGYANWAERNTGLRISTSTLAASTMQRPLIL